MASAPLLWTLSGPCLSHGMLAWASPCFVTKQVPWVVVGHHSQLHTGWKLSIILNRPATGVMTSPCFLPLVAFFQAAQFMTWENLITDFNWHKPTQHRSPAGLSLSLRQPFWRIESCSQCSGWRGLFVCFLPSLLLIMECPVDPAPATSAPWLLWTPSPQAEGQSFYESNCVFRVST